MLTLIVSIWLESSRASLVVTEAAMTALETPQALPKAVLEGTKTLFASKKQNQNVSLKWSLLEGCGR